MGISRSENMRRIKSKDTSIERLLRKALWAKGVRYRKNCKDITGTPDICIKKYKIAIFCDSEFFHGKHYLEQGRIPKTNREYWENKIKKNIERDRNVNKTLKEKGWTVLRFWGKEIKKDPDKCAEKILNIIQQKKKVNDV